MMFQSMLLNNITPSDWSNKNYKKSDHVLVTLNKSSSEYYQYSSKIDASFNGGIKKIDRVQNPFLYGQFQLKQEEYKSRNITFSVTELYHDTAERNVQSIVTNNFDWRLTKRAKFGRGVSFSPSTAYANKQSSSKNGTKRAMIVADVLIGKKKPGAERQVLPRNSDTTTGNGNKVFVKYFDHEFYPKYVVYYKNKNVVKVHQAQKYSQYNPTNEYDDGYYDEYDDDIYDFNYGDYF